MLPSRTFLPAAGDRPRWSAAPGLFPPRSRLGLDPNRLGPFCDRVESFRRRHAALPDSWHLGAFQFLDLAIARERLGPRWALLREKVLGITEGALARLLSPNDLYVALGETLFLLLITDRTPEAAGTAAARLAWELSNALCGDLDGDPAVAVRTLPADPARVLEGVIGLPALLDRLAVEQRRVDETERRSFQRQPGQDCSEWRPVLSLRTRRQVAVRLLVGRREPDGSWADADTLRRRSWTGGLAAELDLLSLCLAWAAPVAGHDRAARLPRVVPVSWTSLDELAPELAASAATPGRALRGRLVLELVGLPASLPGARIAGLLASLRRLGAVPVVRLPPGATGIEHLRSARPLAVVLDLAAVDGAAQLEAIQRLHVRLLGSGVRLGLAGVAPEVAGQAAGLRGTYLAGDRHLSPPAAVAAPADAEPAGTGASGALAQVISGQATAVAAPGPEGEAMARPEGPARSRP